MKIRNAIELKSAIDNATSLSPIGTCNELHREWFIDHFGCDNDEDNEENKNQDDKVLKYVEKLSERLNEKFYSTFNVDFLNIPMEKLEEEKDLNTRYLVKEKKDEMIRQMKLRNTAIEHKNNINRLKNLQNKFLTISDQNNDELYVGGFNLDQEMLQKLYEKAEDSPFGDNQKLETVIDKNVRNAKELVNIQVSEQVCKKIAEEWEKNLFPQKVRVVPYKLNMYTSDGHFTEHRDTPEKDMVGTALISLWEHEYHMPSLHVRDCKKDKEYTWRPSEPDCIMFYTDCPHEVKKSNYNKSKIRATVAFKIYAIPFEQTFDEYKVNSVICALKSFEEFHKDTSYGFILDHDYCLETDVEALKGNDALLVKSLKAMGKNIVILPILHQFNLESYHTGDPSEDQFSSKVFPLTEEHIQYLLTKQGDLSTFPYKDISFHMLGSNRLLWSESHQEYSSYTGNECQSECINSLYISRALIILP